MTSQRLVHNITHLYLLLLALFAFVSHAIPAGPMASKPSSSSSSMLQPHRNNIRSQAILSEPLPKISDIVYGTQCLDPNANLDNLSTAEAASRVCDTDNPYFSSDFCVANSPAMIMTGRSGASLFVLSAAAPSATIVIERAAWQRCFQAARRVCPFGTFTSTCIGGATLGDVDFSLMEADGESLD